MKSGQMPLSRSAGIPLPYIEGLRLDEAMHPLTMLTVGMYGETLPPQDGAPIRLTVPWKYGIQTSLSFQSLPGYRYGLAALSGADGISGPTGQPSAAQLANPSGAGTVWLLLPTTRYSSCPGSSASHRIAYWDMFGRPPEKPRYDRGIPATWWYDPDKAARVQQRDP